MIDYIFEKDLKDIDNEAALYQFKKYSTEVSEDLNRYRCDAISFLDSGWECVLHDILSGIECLSDFDLIRELKDNIIIETLPHANEILEKYPFITKINHGFWEHFAYLNTHERARETYRDVNLELRKRQYLNNDFMPVLIKSWFDGFGKEKLLQMVSCTTGVGSFERVFGGVWSKAEHMSDPGVCLRLPQRGSAKGILASVKLAEKLGLKDKGEPLRFYDSHWLNSSFESKDLISSFVSGSTNKSICLIVGPPNISSVRVVGWRGSHAYLGISSTRAMESWDYNLNNIRASLDYLLDKYDDVVILFQGAVLGPVVADYILRCYGANPRAIKFFDMGRLLDTAFESDITKTGSPLPSGKFSSLGQFEMAEGTSKIFKEFE